MRVVFLNNKIFFRIGLTACFLAFVVIVLGAYVRLSDAGLGCPDWPGCYGQITAPDELEEISKARLAYPDLEIDSGKAWKEMIHRYFASALGLLILFLLFMHGNIVTMKSSRLYFRSFWLCLLSFRGCWGCGR